MSFSSKIEWTDATWNPVTGCSRISEGCTHCYARRMSLRLRAMRQPLYKNGFAPTEHPETLALPFGWKRPRRIFVPSMADLFHSSISIGFICKVYAIMAACPRHTFMVLTKRPAFMSTLYKKPLFPRMIVDNWIEFARDKANPSGWREGLSREFNLSWPIPNLWLGVSVENRRAARIRIPFLKGTPAAKRFLSCEPLLGQLGRLNLNGIHWVIVGGETGPGCRPMKKEWVIEIRDQCLSDGVPFFFKGWGGERKKKTGRALQGRYFSQVPE